ncbi:MAG: HNH endonuclease [Alphaproteobacteria bacterium]
MQAAHIWAVSDGGPDVVQNGIALSATVHWLFDRHLISISDDYRLIVAEGKVPKEFQAVYGRAGAMLHLPARQDTRPHASYLGRHRDAYFRKNGADPFRRDS